jgi:hypothetical protein
MYTGSISIIEIAPDSKSYEYVIRKLIADNETHTKVSARLMGFGTSAALDIADRCLIRAWSRETCNSDHMNQVPPMHGSRRHHCKIVNVWGPPSEHRTSIILLEFKISFKHNEYLYNLKNYTNNLCITVCMKRSP